MGVHFEFTATFFSSTSLKQKRTQLQVSSSRA